MTPAWVRTLLAPAATEALGRILLTFPFWGSGLAKLLDFSGGMGEMRQFGLEPAWLFNVATVIVQLGGSALIIARRGVWLGAGALGIFTLLTILIVHRFWALEGIMGVVSFHTATEHVGMIGALILVSILALRPAASRSGDALSDVSLGSATR
ncbi:DoxX family protein [Roseomonas sp. BN140053]|uniref:DoxX family protein n=1 Tax=Roseomonas sp. BN140053 TaxID=3391898 RepID=UPI0039ED0D26